MPCGEYDLNANTLTGADYSIECNSLHHTNWIRETVDLSAFIGQIVYLNFVNSTCGYGGHCAYAYIDAGCSILSNEVVKDCPGTVDHNLSASPNATRLSMVWAK